jgi:hypothetical protein
MSPVRNPAAAATLSLTTDSIRTPSSRGGEADAEAGAPCGLLGLRVGGDAEDGVG